jgi:hypothetical protein
LWFPSGTVLELQLVVVVPMLELELEVNVLPMPVQMLAWGCMHTMQGLCCIPKARLPCPLSLQSIQKEP